MIAPSREGIRYFEIIRPVRNRPADFLRRIGEHGLRFLGEEFDGSISRKSIVVEEDDNGHVQIGQKLEVVPTSTPRLELYAADSLKLSLARKSTPTPQSQKYKFRYHAARITESVGNSNGRISLSSGRSIAGQIDGLAAEFDLPRGDLNVEFDYLDITNDIVYGSELVLYPKSNSYIKPLLMAQSALARRHLPGGMNTPSEASAPHVAIGRLPENIDKHSYEHFMDFAREELPIILTLGPTDARTDTINPLGC